MLMKGRILVFWNKDEAAALNIVLAIILCFRRFGKKKLKKTTILYLSS